MKKKLSALQYAINLLNRYAKTEQGLRSKMKTKQFTEYQINSALRELKKFNYINDLEYAKNYAHRFKTKGNYLIKQELLRKGVDFSYIENALLELTGELVRGKKVALNKWPTIKAINLKKKQEKLIFFLASRGFSYSACNKISKEIGASIYQDI